MYFFNLPQRYKESANKGKLSPEKNAVARFILMVETKSISAPVLAKKML